MSKAWEDDPLSFGYVHVGRLLSSPEKIFKISSASLCVYNISFNAFGTSSQSFWSQNLTRKYISLGSRETKCWTKSFFRHSQFSLFPSSASFLYIISPMPKKGLAKVSIFSTYSWWHFKDSCFEKIHLHIKDVVLV